MAGYKNNLFEDEQETTQIFPTTLTSAVFNADNESLDVVLNRIVQALHPIGSLYITTDSNNPSSILGGTWTLLTSKMPIGENVFGNGKALGATDSNTFRGLNIGNNFGAANLLKQAFSSNINTSTTSEGDATANKTIGIVTKAQLDNGSYPYSYTGLVMDTITAYIWQRTA